MKPEHLVRYSYDPGKPPAFTEEQKARLADLPDDQIDFSDIPPLTDEFFETAIRGPVHHRPMLLSADVVDWFTRDGEGEPEMMMAINRVLLEHIKAEKQKADKKAG